MGRSPIDSLSVVSSVAVDMSEYCLKISPPLPKRGAYKLKHQERYFKYIIRRNYVLQSIKLDIDCLKLRECLRERRAGMVGAVGNIFFRSAQSKLIRSLTFMGLQVCAIAYISAFICELNHHGRSYHFDRVNHHHYYNHHHIFIAII
mgnify:CR=1 FL=1